ncbi:hypothetical protein [Shewanella youngdeokensis]|uniref:Uncharacterized protein n=1 Tax=Shewanella youngdeokensis TaxID=2999068 RepID=A0ABZ0JXH7_9GAMM|nr:hypothetical protein RGE70_12660 [Shewanella sp. DAU334]
MQVSPSQLNTATMATSSALASHNDSTIECNHNGAAQQPAVTQQPQVDSVTLSSQSITLAAQQDTSANDDVTLPVEPSLPDNGEKVEHYVDYRKAKAQYQFYADIAGVSTDNSHLSPASAYYLSNNEDARQAVVNNKAQQQQAALMQTYVDTTKSINEYS